DIPFLSFIASEFAVGLDGMIHFYKTEKAHLQKEMEEQFIQQMNWSPLLPKPYITTSSKQLLSKLDYNYVRGITATAPGFYGPQGRTIRAELLEPNLPDKLSQVNLNGHKITNLEMESSCLFALSNILGHDALTVCLGIAKRATGEFAADYHPQMQNLIHSILEDVIQ
ncbi:MAG: phosphorylase, partial [Bacteroidales bacterium]|nr:phosphorylase [Bacteroidales bacterium]